MRCRTAARQTFVPLSCSGNDAIGRKRKRLPALPLILPHISDHGNGALERGGGQGEETGDRGRSPARLRRAPRAKLVGSGEAGTGCALIFGLQGTAVRGQKTKRGLRGLILLKGGILYKIHKLIDERTLGRDKLGGNMTLGNRLIEQKRDCFDIFIC